jgi:hypothetical protein
MTLLKIVGVLVALLVIASADAFACSCDTYGQPRKDAKEYFTKEFDGAIFTGTVLSIKHSPEAFAQSELTMAVDQFWLGVKSPTIKLLVSGPDSCWYGWKLGQPRFIIARNFDGTLVSAVCDMENWMPFNSNEKLPEYTTNLLGIKPKSFPKPK